jgi:hypothetical protein
MIGDKLAMVKIMYDLTEKVDGTEYQFLVYYDRDERWEIRLKESGEFIMFCGVPHGVTDEPSIVGFAALALHRHKANIPYGRLSSEIEQKIFNYRNRKGF